jgi:DNA-binding NarL/FixJ family response regulator
MRLVVAIHGREVKTALFLALAGVDAVTIVATATLTAELVSYCRAFRPDVAVVESGLPGRPLSEALLQLGDSMKSGRILVVDGHGASDLVDEVPNAEVFKDIEHLVAALSESGAEPADVAGTAHPGRSAREGNRQPGP